MRRLTQAFLAGIVALLIAWPSAAFAADNTAIAVNTKDGTTIFKVSFKVTRVNQSVVDNGNAAVAISSCNDCQSIAAAYQIVLVFSNPDVVAPVNLALAENVECQTCVAFAAASQWVLGTGGPVHFTAEGNQALAELKQRLQDLSKMDGLTLEQLQAELNEIASEIVDVLAHQLVPSGNSGGNSGANKNDDSATTTGTTTAPEEETTTEPAATTTEPMDTTSGPTTTDGTTTTP